MGDINSTNLLLVYFILQSKNKCQMTSQMGCSAFLFFFLLALDLVLCVRAPCCDFQYGHHLEIGLRQGAEELCPLCGAIFFFWYLSIICGRNTLFSMFTLNGIIMSYMSGRYFHVFSDYFWFMFAHIFWNWDIKVFADVPADYFTNSVVSLCVQLF